MLQKCRFFQTQFHVISKETECTAYKFFSEAFFFLHIINQYEIDNHIIIDICCYRDPSMLDCMYIEAMRVNITMTLFILFVSYVILYFYLYFPSCIYLQGMQKNPDYAKMFRGRPMRFILPLNVDKNEENLIKIPATNAKAFFLPNGTVFVKPEQLCDMGCETPKIHYEKFLGIIIICLLQNQINKEIIIFQERSITIFML